MSFEIYKIESWYVHYKSTIRRNIPHCNIFSTRLLIETYARYKNDHTTPKVEYRYDSHTTESTHLTILIVRGTDHYENFRLQNQAGSFNN